MYKLQNWNCVISMILRELVFLRLLLELTLHNIKLW